MTILDDLAFAICPHLRHEVPCRKCPAIIDTEYDPGTYVCRLLADAAAKSAKAAWDGPEEGR